MVHQTAGSDGAGKPLTYCFDLDGTLCTNTEGGYENAAPCPRAIEVVNRLYE